MVRLTTPEIHDVRDQPSHEATRIRMRDGHETGVIHARYVAINQEMLELWDVFVNGEHVRRSFERADLDGCLGRYGLALPAGVK